MNKSTRVLCAYILALTGMSGCFTSSLYDDKTRTYQETVSSVYVSEDEKNIVVMGEYYHYIIAAPGQVVRTLGSSFHKSVKASFQNFELDSNNKITGEYILRIPAGSDQSVLDDAIQAGYHELPDGSLVFRGVLKGKRYGSGGLKIPVAKKQLNRFYRIRITVPQKDLIKKVLLTPVTVAADGALFIAASPLIAMVLIASGGDLDLR